MTETNAIRIIIGTLDIGGTETHLLKVLPKLVQMGWQIKIIVLSRPGILLHAFQENGVNVQTLFTEDELQKFRKLPTFVGRPLRLIKAVFRLRKEFKNDSFNLTHAFLPEAYVVSMFSAWIFGYKGIRIMSRRSLNEYQKKRIGFGLIENILHTRMDAVLGNSQAIINELIDKEHVLPSKTHLIYNGLDVNAFVPTKNRQVVRESLSINNDCFVMIITANLIPYKGHEDILQALSLMLQSNKDTLNNWCLLCVGNDNGIKDMLIEQATNLGIAKHILWLGLRTDIVDLLQCADLALLTSHEEGFSNALLEYMAASLPIIATAVGGNSEAIIHEESGLLVPPKNPKALSQAILKMVQEREKGKAMGQAARLRLEQHFSLEKCVAEYNSLYKTHLEKSSWNI